MARTKLENNPASVELNKQQNEEILQAELNNETPVQLVEMAPKAPSLPKKKSVDSDDPDKLDPGILVGWRGPSIRMSDALKHLPKYAVKYDTWWDDAVVFRYNDYLHKK